MSGNDDAVLAELEKAAETVRQALDAAQKIQGGA